MSNYNSTLQSNNTDLQAILDSINALPDAGGGEQVTPTISVNSSNGLITATAGTKSSTHQLAFQAAKTIIPSTASQIAVSSGYYTGGAVTVKGDSNLVSENIKSGVSIFGVNGNYAGSGDGDASMEDGLVDRTVSFYTNNRITSIGKYAFYNFTALSSVSFPVCTSIGMYAFASCNGLNFVNFPMATNILGNAFYSCGNLKSISFPEVTVIAEQAFYSCKNLTSLNFPKAEDIRTSAFTKCSSVTSVSFPVLMSIGTYAFMSCSKLVSVSFPAATTISNYAFSGCKKLATIYLGASSLCTLSNYNAFSNTSIWSNKGSIFVPSSLVTSYKTATNWVYFSNRIYSA